MLIAGLQHGEARVALGAMGICFSMHSLAFMAVDGAAGAAATRVANELGGYMCGWVRVGVYGWMFGCWDGIVGMCSFGLLLLAQTICPCNSGLLPMPALFATT